MSGMKNWMLGAAVAAGALGLGAASAQAAEWGVYERGPAYIPPCPGPGYVWVNGYFANGYWVNSHWEYRPMPDGYREGMRGWMPERWEQRRDWERGERRWEQDRHRGRW